MRYEESGLSTATIFAVSVPVMLFQTGLRVTVVAVDDLDPGTVVVRHKGLVRIARADCGSFSSLLFVLRLAGGLIRWHGLSDATRRILEREAERIRVQGDARAAFFQATDVELMVGRTLRDVGSDDPRTDRIMTRLAAPAPLKGGWTDAFIAAPILMFLLPFAYIRVGAHHCFKRYQR